MTYVSGAESGPKLRVLNADDGDRPPPSAAPLRIHPEQSDALPLARPISGEALRNAMLATTVAWIFGNVWVVATSNASITQFAKALGANPFQFGLLTALPYIASLLSLPAVMLIERT